MEDKKLVRGIVNKSDDEKKQVSTVTCSACGHVMDYWERPEECAKCGAKLYYPYKY